MSNSLWAFQAISDDQFVKEWHVVAPSSRKAYALLCDYLKAAIRGGYGPLPVRYFLVAGYSDWPEGVVKQYQEFVPNPSRSEALH